MKAIATLAVLGLAVAAETRENPRFRVDRKVITAHNNNDVLNIDFNKDFNNVQGVKTTVTTQDLKDFIPASLRDYVKNVKVEEKVFTAKNNNGVININMDDADDELFLDVHHQSTRVNANHNSGMMNIGIGRDDADNELRSTVHANDHNERMMTRGHNEKPINFNKWIKPRQDLDAGGVLTADDELFLNFHHESTKVNANHNSGMMNVGIGRDDADNELRTTVHANDNNGMMMIRGHDDELMMVPRYRDRRDRLDAGGVLTADDELMVIPRWTDPRYRLYAGGVLTADDELMMVPRYRDRRERPDVANVVTADDELFLDFTHKGNNVNANHNSGRMNINIHNDDELMMIPRYRDRREHPTVANIATADDEFFLDLHHQSTNVNANHNSGFANINIHNDDELFLDLTHKSTKVNANHNSGMMNIGISHDDADNELASTSWKTDDLYRFPNKKGGLDYVHIKTDNQVNEYHNNKGVTIINRDDADDEFIGINWKNKNIDGSHNSGQMDININNDDELFLDLTHKSTNVNANHNSGMMNINIHNDDADNELAYLGNLLRNQ